MMKNNLPSNDKNGFQWAYILLGVGGFFILTAGLNWIIIKYQQAFVYTSDMPRSMREAFRMVHIYSNQFRPFQLVLGILLLATGYSMIKKWRICTWIIGLITSCGFLVCTPFFIHGITTAAKTFLVAFEMEFSSTLLPIGGMLHFMDSILIPYTVLCTILFLLAPAILVIIGIIIQEKTIKSNNEMTLEIRNENIKMAE